jgi:hypothetical protein
MIVRRAFDWSVKPKIPFSPRGQAIFSAFLVWSQNIGLLNQRSHISRFLASYQVWLSKIQYN